MGKVGTKNDENKWHNEFETIFSINTLNKMWQIIKYALLSNKIKWININILKHLLPTNQSVNKYKPTKDPRCSFCTDYLELLQDFVWSCPVVRDFWEISFQHIIITYPNISLGRKEAIFGDINSKVDSVINILILSAKQFLETKIWIKNINELQFILYMRDKINFSGKSNGIYGK